MSEQNRAVVKHHIDDGWNQGNMSIFDETVAPDFTIHDPVLPGGSISGLDGYKGFVSMYLTAFPDAHFVVEEQFVDGDTVVSRWSGTGTHNGELMGISPTGRKVTMTGILIDRIQHGKLIEQWANYDALGIFQQIGAIPRLPGTA